VTASEKKDRNIKALRRLHLLPFTRKQKIISDLAGLLARLPLNTFPLILHKKSTVV
jgi:phenylacetate-coenzyme A ligase PaaK-like adenylate-forming protein